MLCCLYSWPKLPSASRAALKGFMHKPVKLFIFAAAEGELQRFERISAKLNVVSARTRASCPNGHLNLHHQVQTIRKRIINHCVTWRDHGNHCRACLEINSSSLISLLQMILLLPQSFLPPTAYEYLCRLLRPVLLV